MSSNKGIRNMMIKKYGKKCMMEEAGIREIPQEERRKIKGYKKTQEKLTYHHIKPVSKGGLATEENGAILKNYNHAWLECQPPEVRDKINKQLQEYKQELTMAILINGKVKNTKKIELDFDMSNSISIPLYTIDIEKNNFEERSI